MTSTSQLKNTEAWHDEGQSFGKWDQDSRSNKHYLHGFSGGVSWTLDRHKQLLDQSITNVLAVAREALAMDLVFVSIQVLDQIVVSHAVSNAGEGSIRGMTHPFDESFCQRVLEGELPAIMPDVAALSFTHDVPVTPLTPGAFMTTPVRLQDGGLYGFLCCLQWTDAPELGELHHLRLKMSARQIARLVDEAGER